MILTNTDECFFYYIKHLSVFVEGNTLIQFCVFFFSAASSFFFAIYDFSILILVSPHHYSGSMWDFIPASPETMYINISSGIVSNLWSLICTMFIKPIVFMLTTHSMFLKSHILFHYHCSLVFKLNHWIILNYISNVFIY